ncbi:MAG: hypothetical protein EZS28_007683 [Streblomastix strix]|uniref:Uncharacterized protein n=1 Tax=Streblomastix strix TaxID=222440 RepID=A0A5J4WP88_9EUKA|nr:MAG: hypothetical protein EZS28_007683 [Streblomastix strix]
MNLRQQAKDDKNDGLAQIVKILLNSAFDGDVLNSEKYSNTKLLSANKTFVRHMMSGFMHLTELNEDLYAYDMDRLHFIQEGTDSLTWAIIDNPNRDPDQLFEEVIKYQQFYDTYKNCVFFESGNNKYYISAWRNMAIEELQSLHIDLHAIWKETYEAGIKYAYKSKFCR